MKTAEHIEAIFKNTQRIHGKSKSLDWIKIASIHVERYLSIQLQGLNLDKLEKNLDKELRNENKNQKFT